VALCGVITFEISICSEEIDCRLGEMRIQADKFVVYVAEEKQGVIWPSTHHADAAFQLKAALN
jgi:hypothetical protein